MRLQLERQAEATIWLRILNGWNEKQSGNHLFLLETRPLKAACQSELYIFLFTFRFLFSNVWNCSKWSAIVTTPSSPLWITDGPSEMDHTLQTIRTSRLTHRHTLCFSIFIFVFLAYRHPRLRYRLATLVSLLWTHYFGLQTRLVMAILNGGSRFTCKIKQVNK